MIKNQPADKRISNNIEKLAKIVIKKLSKCYICKINCVYRWPYNGKELNGWETAKLRETMRADYCNNKNGAKEKRIEWTKEVLCWGKIRGNSPETIEKYAEQSCSCLRNNPRGISSWSKILAFRNPDRYFIYDFRVAVVLNYILVNQLNKIDKYFFMPPSRRESSKNVRSKLIDKMNAKINKDVASKGFKLNSQESYSLYLDLILKIVECIKNDKKGCHEGEINGQMVEMALFTKYQDYEQCILDEVINHTNCSKPVRQ